MPAGRPTLYEGEATIAQVDEYLASCVDVETERVKSDGDKTTSYELGVKVNLPMIEGFAQFIGVHLDTVYEWEKKYPEFSEALGKIRVEQKKRLLNSGLSNIYNPLIAKLVLSANHGMADKAEVDHKNDGGKFEAGAMTPAMMAIVKKAEEEMKEEVLK